MCAVLYHDGNKMPLGGSSAPAGGGPSVENEIIEKTKSVAFPTEAQISLENFDHCGDMPAGTQQSLNDMAQLAGKTLQESYRVGHPESQRMTQKVSDR
jgi:hypothetical protein